jgi:BASS family bile acid:Na+ symporter
MTTATLLPLALQSSIFLLVLSLGLNADLRSALYLFARPSRLLRAFVAMAVVVPAVAVAMALTLDLPHAAELVLVALALSPMPPVLPLKAMKAGADREYAVGLLAAAAALSIVIIPVLLLLIDPLFPARLAMPLGAVAKVVLASVLVPLALGMLAHQFAPTVSGKAARPVLLLATAILVAALLPMLITAWAAILSLIGNGTVGAMAALVAIGLAAGHLLAGPVPGERTLLAMASGARHPGVAMALLHANFPEEKLILPAVLLYLLVGVLVAMPYIQWAKRDAASRRRSEG